MGEIGGAIQRINNPFIRRRLIGMYPFFFGQNLMGGLGLLEQGDNGVFRFAVGIGHQI